MQKAIRSILQTLTICLIVILGAGILYAWTGPTADPPNNNTAPPINTSSADQVKQGGLGVSDLMTNNLGSKDGSWLNLRDNINARNNMLNNVRRIRVNNTIPSSDDELASKEYVDSQGGGLSDCTTRSSTNGGHGWATVYCPAGYKRTGCSTEILQGQNTQIYERPVGNNGCRGAEPNDWSDWVRVYAYCCK